MFPNPPQLTYCKLQSNLPLKQISSRNVMLKYASGSIETLTRSPNERKHYKRNYLINSALITK